MLNPFFKRYILFVLMLLPASLLRAQTDLDAIMMLKNNFCVGGSYMYSSGWSRYVYSCRSLERHCRRGFYLKEL